MSGVARRPRKRGIPGFGEDEEHPSFALIGAYRVSSTPGASLFDSEIRHGHYVRIHIKSAVRQRGLNRDWIHGRKQYIEIALSEVQWASFISTLNSGDGVPCTLTTLMGERVESPPYEPRMALSMAEVEGAVDRIFGGVKDALKTYTEKPTKANLHELRIALDNSTPNVRFANESVAKHVEDVVTKARADIEAMVKQYADRAGIEAGSVEHPFKEIEG